MTYPFEDETSYPPASVLVVDDQPANLIAMRALLRTLGHTVVTVPSGQEALRAVETQEFAVILMDVHMPILDGFETVARLRREHPTVHTPVLFISAVYDQTPHVSRGYALGAVDYLPRPMDPDLLRAKVASFVSLYRRGAELRRRAEIIREQTTAAERARAASRLKDVYLGVIGHDLRVPLGVVALVAGQLRNGPTPETSRTLAERLERVVRRCDAIVGNLLDFTKGELGDGIAVEPVTADMGEIARSVVNELSLLHSEREIRLETPADLGGKWDVQRAEQVLANLIHNAVQHGSGPISVALHGSEEAVAFAIHNAGVIPADLLPRIFDPFQRGQGRSAGLGLGLYIVREILRAHDGAIEVESSAEHGTTFTARWPRRPPSERSTAEGASASPAPNAALLSAGSDEARSL
jgi:signal transduction histidine kinase